MAGELKFKYLQKQDRYFIKNNEEDDAIKYVVKHLFDCNSFLTITDGEILPGSTKEFKFIEDGEYQIILNGEYSTTIKHYLKLQNSIIEGIVDTICDCGCGCNCDGKDDKCCKLLTLRAKIDVYKRITEPFAEPFYNDLHAHVKCLILKPLYCGINKEIILGESDCNEKITEQMIALDYLSMYFYEMSQTCLEEDQNYVRNKFKTKPIFCCIEALGLNIKDLEKEMNSTLDVCDEEIYTGCYPKTF